jgi:hypothetical protein
MAYVRTVHARSLKDFGSTFIYYTCYMNRLFSKKCLSDKKTTKNVVRTKALLASQVMPSSITAVAMKPKQISSRYQILILGFYFKPSIVFSRYSTVINSLGYYVGPKPRGLFPYLHCNRSGQFNEEQPS